MHMDARKYLGLGVGALGVNLGHAIGDFLAALAQDVDHVERGAAAHADQHQLHRPAAAVFATKLWWPVHRDLVAAVGTTLETNLADPANSGFHDIPR